MNGIELIAAERQRQIEQEGWTPEHDDQHDSEELNQAARCYALAAEACAYSEPCITYEDIRSDWPRDWPWAKEWWKPSPDPIRNLVKAGALIAAEIDRLQRKQIQPPANWHPDDHRSIENWKE